MEEQKGHICRDCGHVVAEHKKLEDSSWACFYGWQLFGIICYCKNGFEITKIIK